MERKKRATTALVPTPVPCHFPVAAPAVRGDSRENDERLSPQTRHGVAGHRGSLASLPGTDCRPSKPGTKCVNHYYEMLVSQLSWAHKIQWVSRVFVLGMLMLLGVAMISGIHQRSKYALFNAAEHGDLNEVKFLVQHGVSINQTLASDFGFTPLIAAIYHDNTNVVYYLVDVGADINLADKNGVTPLMWLTGWGDSSVPLVKYLIAHGARLDAKDKHDTTVFDYAKSDPPKQKLIETLETAKLAQESKATDNETARTNNTPHKP
jgi:hypothetical protein